MSKQEAKKIAEQFIMRHKEAFKTGNAGVTEREIKAAVNKVARALATMISSEKKMGA